MSRFGMIVEDPMYDEDGVLVDEDADWSEIDDSELDELGIDKDNLSPYSTINS